MCDFTIERLVILGFFARSNHASLPSVFSRHQRGRWQLYNLIAFFFAIPRGIWSLAVALSEDLLPPTAVGFHLIQKAS